MFRAFIAAVLFSQATICVCAAQSWSGAGGDNNWSTASNWVGGVAPVSGGTTEVTFSNPSLRNSPFQNIADPFSLNRLEFNSSAGSWNLSGQAIRFTGGGSWIRWGGSQAISVANNWVIHTNTNTVANGASVELVHSGEISGAAHLTVTDGRTLRQTGTHTGTGRLHVVGSSSTLIIDGSTAAGSGGIVLGVSGDGFTAGFGTLRGTGTINGNITAANSSSLVNNFIGSSGTLVVNGNILGSGSSARLRFDTGTVQANGLISSGAGAIFSVASGATVAGSGAIDVASDGKLSVSGVVDSSKTIQLNASSGGLNFSTNWGGISGGSGTINANISSQGGRILGSGLVINGNIEAVHSASQATLIGHYGDVNGARSSLAINGTARFQEGSGGTNGGIAGDISGTGQILVEANTLVSFGGGAGLTGAVITDVETTVRGGIGGNATFNGLVRLEGGTLSAGSQMALNREIRTTGTSRILSIASGTTFNGVTTIESGSLEIRGIMEGTGSMTQNAGASFQLGDAATRMRLQLNAKGTLTGSSGARFENTVNLLGASLTGPLRMDAALNVIDNQTSTMLAGSTTTANGLTSINDAVLRVLATATLTGSGALAVGAGGVLDVQGLVIKSTTVDELGAVRGIGTLRGQTDVFGSVDPGNSAGTLNIDGRIDLKSTSTLTIEIGGTTPGSGFDRLAGAGSNPTANLGGGNLNLRLINGFVPNQGDQFQFLTGFTSITGSFGNTGGGFNFDRIYFADGSFAIEYLPTSLRLFDFQAVPEPGCMAIAALCVCGACIRRRSRGRVSANQALRCGC